MSLVALNDDMITRRLEDVKIIWICEVKSFDKESMRADVLPLYKHDDGQGNKNDFAIIRNVPVLFELAGDYYIRPEYKAGDLVAVGFSERNIDKAARGFATEQSKEMFNAKGAVVIRGMAKTNWTPPVEFATTQGLVIGHKDGGAFMQMQSDRVSMKFGTTEVRFLAASGPAGGIEIYVAGIKVFGALSHVHPTAIPGTPSPPQTGT